VADNQRDWQALLRQAQERHRVYAAVMVSVDLALKEAEAKLSPQGEATDQLVQMGLDVTKGAPGSNVTRDVLGLCREGANTHNKAIAQIHLARNNASRALTQNMLAVARINDAIGEVGGI